MPEPSESSKKMAMLSSVKYFVIRQKVCIFTSWSIEVQVMNNVHIRRFFL